MNHLTTEEQERAAYMMGDTRTADLLGQLEDITRAHDDLEYKLDNLPSKAQRNQNAQDLEELKEFFYSCFQRLAGDYPCPSWSSDYDKNVIFEAIEKGAAQ